MCFGPHASEMGTFDDRQRPTAVQRLWGQNSIAPSGVLAQSIDRTSLPISPPPTSQSSARGGKRSGGSPDRWLDIGPHTSGKRKANSPPHRGASLTWPFHP